MEYSKVYGNERGQIHRVDGPAIIHDKRKVWYYKGEFHRVDGPAYINGDYQQWLINGKRIYQHDYIHEEIKDCIYGI